MVVAYEEDREGVKDLMFLSALSCCLEINETEGLPYSLLRILSCETSVDEVI